MVLDDDTPCRGTVTNISAGGAHLRTDRPLEAGTRLSVDIRRIGRVTARIAWASGYEAGLAFDTSPASSPSLREKIAWLVKGPTTPSGAHHERRNAPRETARRTARLALPDGKICHCDIVDESSTGARIRVAASPAIGAQVWLGQRPAQVVRCGGGEIGIAFATLHSVAR